MTRPAIRPEPSSVEREYDALADLFLSDAGFAAPAALAASPSPRGPAPREAASASPPAPSAAPAIELVLLGHLPVLGSAWVGPYAAHRAAAISRPVGLVRLVDGVVSLDVVPRVPELDEADTLEEAVGIARRHVGAWIVRVGAAHEAAAAREQRVARVTMLTAANDPAILASYRTIKSLAAGDGPLKAGLGVALIGAAEEEAAGAIARLADTVQSQLHRDLGRAERVQRVGACPMSGVYLGEWSGGITDLFALLTREPTSPPALSLARHASDEEDEPAVVVLPRPGAPAPEIPPSLATPPPSSQARIPGLESLGALCPLAPRVDVAIDADRRINLVATVAADESVGDAVQSLLAASSWADAHSQLLSHVRRGISGEQPVLHLLTDAAPRVRSVLDTRIRLHLLVDAGAQRLVRPLN